MLIHRHNGRFGFAVDKSRYKTMGPNHYNKKRGRNGWTVLLILFLQYLSHTEGEVYVNQRMRPVTTFNTSSNTICVQAIQDQPKLVLRLKLMVWSQYTEDVISAGEVNVRQKLLSPVFSNHVISIRHIEDNTTAFGAKVHILKVLLDGEEVEFVKETIDAYAHVYSFDHIILLMKGTADIYPCEGLSTSTTTTSTTTTTTTPVPTTVSVTTTEEPPVLYMAPDGGSVGGSADEENIAESPSDVLYHNPEGTDDVHSVLSETLDSEDESDSGDSAPWWDFVFVLGDFKSIPVLVLLIIAFCVGLGVGSVGTILCEQYCCCPCTDDDDEENKLHDASFDHRMIARTDFNGDSSNPMYMTSLSSGRITKESISSPIQPTLPRPDPYDVPHYQSPRDDHWTRSQREHPHSNSSDETIPLNVPLPRENQMPNNYAHCGGSYEHYDHYKEKSLNL